MATIITRAGKGSPLTFAEADANFTNLNTAKLEAPGGLVSQFVKISSTNILEPVLELNALGLSTALRIPSGSAEVQDGTLSVNKSTGGPDLFVGGGFSSHGIVISSQSGSNGGSYVSFDNAGSTHYIGHGGFSYGTADFAFVAGTGGSGMNFRWYTFNTERMRLTSAGFLGIGTNTPSTSLDVLGSGGVAATFRNSTSGTATIEFSGTTTTNNVRLGAFGDVFTLNTGGSERIRVDSTGNVGIGVNAPNAPLEIVGTNAGSALVVQRLRNAGTTSATASTLSLMTNTNSGVAISLASLSGIATNTTGGGDLAISTSSPTGVHTERLRIDSAGKVLVGTTSSYQVGVPTAAPLQLAGTSENSSSASFSRYSADASSPYITLAKSRGAAVGTMTAVTTNDVLGRVDFAGADGIDLAQIGASIRADVDNTVASNSIPSRIVFSTTALAGTSPTERLRIDSVGRVLVGTTSSNTIAGSAGQIQVAGTTGDTSSITQSRWNAGGNPAYFVMGASRGASIGTQGLVSNNDEVARIQFAASDGAAMQSVGYIAAIVDGVAALNDTPGRLVFRTTPAGSVTPLERLRIDSAGNVGIGITTFGTSAARVLSIGSGTEPSTAVADSIQLGSVDLSAGNTIPFIRAEGTGITAAGITNTTVTNKIAVKINGTVYYLLATTNGT